MSYSLKTGAVLFSILCASVTFAGCGDDDDDTTPTSTAGQGGEPSKGTGGGDNGGQANNGQAGDTNSAGDTSAGGNPSHAGNGGGGEATAGASGATGGAGGAGPELACTQLKYGAAVFAEYVTTAEPDPEGGTPVNGTYQLTKLTHYGSAQASTSNDPIHSALKIAGDVIEFASQAKEDEETRGSYTFTVDDTELALTNVCPIAGPGDGTPFTADGDTIILYLDAEYTFTK